jgi:hypothetical protein
MSTTSVPALLRQQVDRWAERWLKAKFARLLELRAQDPDPYNFPIAVFSEWRGKAFYLNVRYRARSRKPEDDFVVRPGPNGGSWASSETRRTGVIRRSRDERLHRILGDRS